MRLSIHDNSVLRKFEEEIFPNATNLNVTGYSIRCDIPDMSSVISSLPKLETISLRNGTISWDHIINYCRNANNLETMTFVNCCFDAPMNGTQIIQIARLIKKRHNRFPLGLKFDRIQSITSNDTTSICSNMCGSELSLNDICSYVSETESHPKEITTYGGIQQVSNSLLKHVLVLVC